MKFTSVDQMVWRRSGWKFKIRWFWNRLIGRIDNDGNNWHEIRRTKNGHS